MYSIYVNSIDKLLQHSKYKPSLLTLLFLLPDQQCRVIFVCIMYGYIITDILAECGERSRRAATAVLASTARTVATGSNIQHRYH